MRVNVLAQLNDPGLVAGQGGQRQVSIALTANPEGVGDGAPLNLCLILDHSGSMAGQPLETVKQAAKTLVDRLDASDRLSVVAFDHKAKTLVPNQLVTDTAAIKAKISSLEANGGTAIDLGMKLGIEQLAEGKKGTISQAFLLTDGENEHGDNDRCLSFAKLAASYNITLNSLGFGYHWNQDVLEQIADAGGGQLSFIEYPEQAVVAFTDLLKRVESVGLTNAHLVMELADGVKLADYKPIAQVAPDTIELEHQVTNNGTYSVRVGDLLVDTPRTLLVNLYTDALPDGPQVLAYFQVCYDDPATGKVGVVSERVPISIQVSAVHQPQVNPEVQKSILTLAKYRQTQIAETKLQQGDRTGAATLLQSAAQTARQMGDEQGATVLQKSATQLQSGKDLSEADRKKTRMVSKTMLSGPTSQSPPTP
ncbi:VWA domain-containing protein [Candidatus Synechococcus calcipolaris G9]|uniref:VWA domain-containing protein n=1 Tax=Candidatus Synechococcus calcipolaris G9 TaxID=1497997 RepID=A0ABT6F0B0_9SYNE|nr:VWA domain-containing protein [Candidatus Synechococcus calcipolaris]MDG2991296.1 VWA domain-containing protein [Candidatus Synechococcus calcipolaris G9]